MRRVLGESSSLPDYHSITMQSAPTKCRQESDNKSDDRSSKNPGINLDLLGKSTLCNYLTPEYMDSKERKY